MNTKTREPVLKLDGMPANVSAEQSALCRVRIFNAVKDVLRDSEQDNIDLRVHTMNSTNPQADRQESVGRDKERNVEDEITVEQRAQQFQPMDPLYSFDHLILPKELKEQLWVTVKATELEAEMFEKWGLSEIEPNPVTALNFFGPPGTGKTLAAHAVASALKRPILVVTGADVASKFVGDGPKNVKAVYYSGRQHGAVVFFDEADSLVSQRFQNPTQGSEQASNSMTSQMLMCTQQYNGLVIFATNMPENYDTAFDTRVRQIAFPFPNAVCREGIWRAHLPTRMPLASDVDLTALATEVELSGREIKEAIRQAAGHAYVNECACVTQEHLLTAARQRFAGRKQVRNSMATMTVTPVPSETRTRIIAALQRQAEATGTNGTGE